MRSSDPTEFLYARAVILGLAIRQPFLLLRRKPLVLTEHLERKDGHWKRQRFHAFVDFVIKSLDTE
jgi:hypothetical protein